MNSLKNQKSNKNVLKWDEHNRVEKKTLYIRSRVYARCFVLL
jgi:hypothetical protein